MAEEQRFQAEPDQDAQADQGRVGEPDDPGHLAAQQRGGMDGGRGLRRDHHPPGAGHPVHAVRVMPGRRIGPVGLAADPCHRSRGHRPLARVDAADLSGDGHRPAARDDPVDGFLLPEGVAGLGLPGDIGPAAGEPDRGAERFAGLAGIEPVGRREQFLDGLRGPLGHVVRGAGGRGPGLGGRRWPFSLRGTARPRGPGLGRTGGGGGGGQARGKVRAWWSGRHQAGRRLLGGGEAGRDVLGRGWARTGRTGRTGRCCAEPAAEPSWPRGFRAGCSSCSSSSAASSSFPGWHHMVAAGTGRMLDRSWRAHDVWMKTTDYRFYRHTPELTGGGNGGLVR